jgi:hypothetical protein
MLIKNQKGFQESFNALQRAAPNPAFPRLVAGVAELSSLAAEQ